METISSIKNAATKAIWGENQNQNQSHEEPVSGKMGDVAAGEPYDAGNIGGTLPTLTKSNEEALSKPEQPHREESSETKPAGTGTTTTLPVRDSRAKAEQAQAAATPLPPTPAPEQQKKEKEQPEKRVVDPSAVPSASGMGDDSTQAQNDTRAPPPPTAPSTTLTPQVTDIAAAANKQTTHGGAGEGIGKKEEEGPKMGERKDDDKKEKTKEEEDIANRPVNVEGPGPRPIEELARERGGDAGNSAPSAQAQTKSPAGAGAGQNIVESVGTGDKTRRDSAKGLEEEHHDVRSAGKGDSGEAYVKSSGLAAEGGDFDASRPGAAREADRLLEQKGVQRGDGGITHHSAHGQQPQQHTSGKNGGEHHEKTSLKDKIKAKLHKPSVSS